MHMQVLPCAPLHIGRAKLSHTSALPTFKAVEGVAVAVGIPQSQALHLDPEVKGAASVILVVALILRSSMMEANAVSRSRWGGVETRQCLDSGLVAADSSAEECQLATIVLGQQNTTD
jgi:hypothetical protein